MSLFVIGRYLPQSFLLTFVNGPLAFISTIALVLSESAAIITALSRTFLIEEALVDIFDAVLLEENCMQLVSQGRELKPGGGGIGKLGKMMKRYVPPIRLRSNSLLMTNN